MTPEDYVRKASITINKYMHTCKENIDNLFGKGYASKHPDLLGLMITACAKDFHTGIMHEETIHENDNEDTNDNEFYLTNLKE